MVLAALIAGVSLCNPAHVCGQDPQIGQIPTGSWRIAGTVVNANTGVPLARTRLTIQDTKIRRNTQNTISSDSGHFEFHVPAGKFALQGAKRGFITGAYNQHDQYSTAIVTGVAGVDSGNLTLRLAPNAVLSGKVLDEYGEPVRQSQVMVYRESRFSGVSRITRFRGTVTDDLGRYEVTPLDSGTYFVSVKASPWYAMHPPSNREGPNSPVQVDPGLDVAYPVTFYGDATEADEATPIPVRGGDHLEADIHVNPTPALHLLFHAGDNGSPIAYPELQRSVFDGLEEVDGGNFEMVSPGMFELTGVATGRYLVRMPDSNGHLKEPIAANLTNSQELDTAAGNSTSTVKVKVELTGANALPAPIQIGLRSSQGAVIASRTDAKGEATFSEVIPGKYDMMAGSPNDNYTVTRVRGEGGAIAGRSLNVPAASSVSVTATLIGGSVTIDGFAKQNGKGFAGAMVVLIPDNPEANIDRFHRDQTDLDGSFTLYNVTPGTYTVIAIENGWDLDWAKPAVLAHYGSNGPSVTVQANQKGTVHLAATVTVAQK
ncbi:MAG: carboxypeptidase regulatory-like domain-containing protein [Acidobacteria bacterium]|nr:carboxypeptidase regulatory-like domain-containing protein [Acidobacteriota bacterium]